jgi:hypothetical protein
LEEGHIPEKGSPMLLEINGKSRRNLLSGKTPNRKGYSANVISLSKDEEIEIKE